MIAVLITLTPGHRNEFIDCQNAKVRIAVLPILDVKTRWNSTLELLEHANRLHEFIPKWLKNPKYSDYRPLFTTQDEWTIVKCVMEVLRALWYWTLWMSKGHSITLHHVITVYNDILDHMDGIMRALAKKQTPWKEDPFFAVNFARRKLSKWYTEVTPMTGMLHIGAHILDPFRKLRLFRTWEKGMDINPEDETSYTTQYHKAFPKYVENKYCAEHRRLPVTNSENIQTNNLSFSAMASKSGQSSYDSYDLCSNDEEYLMPNNVAETTPVRSDRAAPFLTAARLSLNSTPELPQNWGQINPNLNEYHSDPMEISRACWLPDITD